MPLDFTRRPQKRRMGPVKLLFATLIILAAALVPPALLAADRTVKEAKRAPLHLLGTW